MYLRGNSRALWVAGALFAKVTGGRGATFQRGTLLLWGFYDGRGYDGADNVVTCAKEVGFSIFFGGERQFDIKRGHVNVDDGGHGIVATTRLAGDVIYVVCMNVVGSRVFGVSGAGFYPFLLFGQKYKG